MNLIKKILFVSCIVNSNAAMPWKLDVGASASFGMLKPKYKNTADALKEDPSVVIGATSGASLELNKEGLSLKDPKKLWPAELQVFFRETIGNRVRIGGGVGVGYGPTFGLPKDGFGGEIPGSPGVSLFINWPKNSLVFYPHFVISVALNDKFSAGLVAGLAGSYRTFKAKGIANVVTTKEEKQSSFDLGLKIGPELSYQFSKRAYLDVGADFTYWPKVFSGLSTTDHTGGTWSVALKIGARFTAMAGDL